MEDSDGIFRASFGVHPRIERRGGARKQSMLQMLEPLLGGLRGVVAWWADPSDGTRRASNVFFAHRREQ